MGLHYRLDLFKIKSTNPFIVNFRCPYCGDSKKNKYKARANLYENDENIFFKCFNCGFATSGEQFLQYIDRSLYDDYRMELFHGRIEVVPTPSLQTIKEPPKNESFLTGLMSVDGDRDAIAFLESRLIPKESYNRLYYTPNYAAWVSKVSPKYAERIKDYGPRIVFPFNDKNGDTFGAQARALDRKSYDALIFKDGYKKSFGLDVIDWSKPHYAVEGPIDSLFLPNCFAMVGMQLEVDCNKELLTIVLDNEPRNKDVVRQMDKYLSQGFRVCIWPDSMCEKDLNDCVLRGTSPATIKQTIDAHTYRGIEGLARLSIWRKS